ncbi:chorismate mutase [Bombiscardovia apis]|uniref:Prephenate dehydratase n=1 Tax=Bombiscardovia apis TaxID=2932182 RepID=A0ABM8BD47_9BIFI|nr:prephenate dehydratase domain-containing protein [Bombiscardovia apis]BDR54828.1 chorismate mutase [Bombiscardovia apis]
MTISAQRSSAQARNLYYLGPEGSFTHQSALEASNLIGRATGQACSLVALDQAASIVSEVEAGHGLGILAWENNVEGTVVPNMDALINARYTAGFAKISLDIVFDAFVLPHHDNLTQVSAHPHGLAQCKTFVGEHGLHPEPASSNAAACRDLAPHQIGLGPRICGSLYGLETYAQAVQDYKGAHTDFVLLAPRAQVADLAQACEQASGHSGDQVSAFESILALIPFQTGPGVLANVLDQVRDAGLNMTSFMSRPIKGYDGTYSFVVSLDAAPWEPQLRSLMEDLTRHDVWLKTLAVCPRTIRPNPPVDQCMLPTGGVERLDLAQTAESVAVIREELLW